MKNTFEELLYFVVNVVDSPLQSDNLQSKIKVTLPHSHSWPF